MLAHALIAIFLWQGTPATTWQSLLDARLQRNTQALQADDWQVGKKSRLALQEYLLTLGQVGNPADAARVASFFSDAKLAHSALLAYGEIDGAAIAPLVEAFPALDNDGKLLAIESMTKLGSDSDIATVWRCAAQLENPDLALFHLWRLRSDASDQAIIANAAKQAGTSSGVAFYLYRGRVKASPQLISDLLKKNAEDTQALIYTLRIPAAEGDTVLLKKVVQGLTRHFDWRIRVNALNALATVAEPEALAIAMDQRFDDNPNVVANAMALLGRAASAAQHKTIAAQAKALQPAHLLSAARSASPETFKTHYQGMIATWKHHASSWRRGNWVRMAAKMDHPRAEQTLRELASSEAEGMTGLALQALAAGEYAAWPEVAQQTWQRVSKTPDPMLMGDLAGSISKSDEGWQPIALEKLLEAAAKSYRDPKFQYDLINQLSATMSAEELAPLLAKWADHPDYLVRLKAVTTMAEPGPARGKIYQQAWQHAVPKELQTTAAANFTNKDKVYWELKTAKGSVTIQLYASYAPITVANIMYLSARGFWNNLPLHRVVPNFVVQGGDVRGDGMGGPEHIIPCEINALRYRRGAVGMALSGKDTGGSQFFICHSDQPHLDGGYTVFGSVVKGMNIVDILQEGDLIESTRVYRK